MRPTGAFWGEALLLESYSDFVAAPQETSIPPQVPERLQLSGHCPNRILERNLPPPYPNHGQSSSDGPGPKPLRMCRRSGPLD